MPTYKANVRDTAAGQPGDVAGQAEIERADEDSTIRVKTISGNTKSVGNPTGDGASRQYVYQVGPHDDKPGIFMEEKIGRA
jgi:hypothetical protein